MHGVGRVVPLALAIAKRTALPSPDKPQHAPLLTAIHETALAALRASPAARMPGYEWCASLLKMVGREHDEALHSDFIAALLTPRTAGHLARRLFDGLFELGREGEETRPPRREFQVSYRGVGLETLVPNPNPDGAARPRIDVLARTRTRVLVIENRTHSAVSRSRTAEIADTVTACYDDRRWRRSFVLLSPGGRTSGDPRFKGVSFLELFELLREVRRTGECLERAARLADAYLTELAAIFVAPEVRNVMEGRRALQQAGYEDV